jgi:hypothetical protein
VPALNLDYLGRMCLDQVEAAPNEPDSKVNGHKDEVVFTLNDSMSSHVFRVAQTVIDQRSSVTRLAVHGVSDVNPAMLRYS